MGGLATDTNCAKNYRGGIYCIVSIKEECFTFRGSDKVNQGHAWTSMRHSKITVQYFVKPIKVHKCNEGVIKLVTALKM